MKKALLILGAILTLYALYALFPYILDFSKLSEYGKGYIIGNFAMLAVGVVLIIFGVKKK